MFHMLIERPLHRYSHATARERRTVRVTLTHLPTGRRWVFGTRKAAFAARAALTAAVAEGRLSILPPERADAEDEVLAAA